MGISYGRLIHYVDELSGLDTAAGDFDTPLLTVNKAKQNMAVGGKSIDGEIRLLNNGNEDVDAAHTKLIDGRLLLKGAGGAGVANNALGEIYSHFELLEAGVSAEQEQAMVWVQPYGVVEGVQCYSNAIPAGPGNAQLTSAFRVSSPIGFGGGNDGLHQIRYCNRAFNSAFALGGKKHYSLYIPSQSEFLTVHSLKLQGGANMAFSANLAMVAFGGLVRTVMDRSIFWPHNSTLNADIGYAIKPVAARDTTYDALGGKGYFFMTIMNCVFIVADSTHILDLTFPRSDLFFHHCLWVVGGTIRTEPNTWPSGAANKDPMPARSIADLYIPTFADVGKLRNLSIS